MKKQKTKQDQKQNKTIIKLQIHNKVSKIKFITKSY